MVAHLIYCVANDKASQNNWWLVWHHPQLNLEEHKKKVDTSIHRSPNIKMQEDSLLLFQLSICNCCNSTPFIFETHISIFELCILIMYCTFWIVPLPHVWLMLLIMWHCDHARSIHVIQFSSQVWSHYENHYLLPHQHLKDFSC